MKNQPNLLPSIIMSSLASYCATVPIAPLLVVGILKLLHGNSSSIYTTFPASDFLAGGAVAGAMATLVLIVGLIPFTLIAKNTLIETLQKGTYYRWVHAGGILAALLISVPLLSECQDTACLAISAAVSVCMYLGIAVYGYTLTSGLKKFIAPRTHSDLGYVFTKNPHQDPTQINLEEL